jgi:beta-glucanase (GH16 family)
VTENWDRTTSQDFILVPLGGSTVRGGQPDSLALDGKAATLAIRKGAGSTPANAAEVETKRQFRYGSFTSRVRTADCSSQPTTGAVTGIFTYGNDGRDGDGDGLTDNSELDVEVLCARPDELHLSIWTDYRDSDEAQQRVSRIVNLRTGTITSTCYATSFGSCQPLSGAESSPTAVSAVPDFDSAKRYYDYRIDWSADRVVFTVTAGGKEITLWDYRGPAQRIPRGNAAYMVNLWHTDNWSPDGMSAVSKPTAPLTVSVDSSTVPATS